MSIYYYTPLLSKFKFINYLIVYKNKSTKKITNVNKYVNVDNDLLTIIQNKKKIMVLCSILHDIVYNITYYIIIYLT